MQKISTGAELKEAIAQLEAKRDLQGKKVKDQFNSTYESFKTINLFKKMVLEIVTSPGLMSGIITTAIELTSRKSVKRKEVEGNTFRNIIGTLFSTAITRLVDENTDAIVKFGQLVVKRMFQKRAKEQVKKENE
ncbi:MAG: hypothetical protein Q8908_00685 [Bacteroidota bacterium]|nr:hypothetical protein [Bacteroidota bacterium]